MMLAQVERPDAKEPYTPITIEQIIIWVAVTISLILVALYVVGIFRSDARSSFDGPEDHLDDFRRLREEGMMDDEEYSRVKSSIASDSQEQIDFREDRTEDVDNPDQAQTTPGWDLKWRMITLQWV